MTLHFQSPIYLQGQIFFFIGLNKTTYCSRLNLKKIWESSCLLLSHLQRKLPKMYNDDTLATFFLHIGIFMKTFQIRWYIIRKCSFKTASHKFCFALFYFGEGQIQQCSKFCCFSSFSYSWFCIQGSLLTVFWEA